VQDFDTGWECERGMTVRLLDQQGKITARLFANCCRAGSLLIVRIERRLAIVANDPLQSRC
jgi:hypothetical protein